MLILSNDLIGKVVLFRDSDFHFRSLRRFVTGMTSTKEGNLLVHIIGLCSKKNSYSFSVALTSVNDEMALVAESSYFAKPCRHAVCLSPHIYMKVR